MDINIEEIMNEIRAEIKEKGYTADMLSFSDVVAVTPFSGEEGKFSANEFNGVVSYLGANAAVPVSMPLRGNPIIVFIKKLIRKFTRVTIRPVTEHQSEYNTYTARAFGMIETHIADNDQNSKKLAELVNKVEILDLRLKSATKEIEQLQIKIKELENEKKADI